MEFEIMDSRGVPSLKALWHGIIIDCDDAPNRHLNNAGLAGHEILVELVEVEDDFDDEEAENEDEEEEVGEEDPDDAYEHLDDDDPDVECTRYPDGCEACKDLQCTGPDAEPSEDDILVIDFVLRIRQKPKGPWYDVEDGWIEENPALCRFLNQINDAHGL
jgi:hypothetical protein